MEKVDLDIQMLKVEKDYSERQVRQAIKTLRGILDRVEKDLEEGRAVADNGLQGNEWRLYKELSNLEMKTQFLETLNRINEK